MTRRLLIAALAALGLGIAWAMGGAHNDADNHRERPEWDEYRHALRNGLS